MKGKKGLKIGGLKSYGTIRSFISDSEVCRTNTPTKSGSHFNKPSAISQQSDSMSKLEFVDKDQTLEVLRRETSNELFSHLEHIQKLMQTNMQKNLQEIEHKVEKEVDEEKKKLENMKGIMNNRLKSLFVHKMNTIKSAAAFSPASSAVSR